MRLTKERKNCRKTKYGLSEDRIVYVPCLWSPEMAKRLQTESKKRQLTIKMEFNLNIDSAVKLLCLSKINSSTHPITPTHNRIQAWTQIMIFDFILWQPGTTSVFVWAVCSRHNSAVHWNKEYWDIRLFSNEKIVMKLLSRNFIELVLFVELFCPSVGTWLIEL